MCKLCGCADYIGLGNEAVLRRAVEIVRELGITAQNLADYEDTELICSLIAPFGSRADEIYQTAAWVSDLHAIPGLVNRNVRYPEYLRAFRDIFERLPVHGNPRHIATTYHQLEQLNKELDDAALGSLDPDVREALRALRNVHDQPEAREAHLRERHGL
jgi:hypothetical protein